jgi:hypothetical protein
MSDSPSRPPSTDRERRRRRQKSGSLGWPFWLGLILVVATCAWFLVNLGQQAETPTTALEPTDEPIVDEPAAGDRAVVLVFPEWDASSYVSERRRIPSRGRPEEDLQALMDALCAGPQRSGAISALPERTRVLATYLDATGEHAVVDFSSELVIHHPGGSAAEAATLTSILRTVALNFPNLQTCRILVDGAEVETLGGHLTLATEFDLRRWL